MTPEQVTTLCADDVELLHWALLNLEPTLFADEVLEKKWAARCAELRNVLFMEHRRRRRP